MNYNKNNIELETITKATEINGVEYKVSEYYLKVNDKYFDSDLVTENSKKLQKQVHLSYWKAFSSLFVDGVSMVVKLSGLHFNIDNVKEYIVHKNLKTNIVLHYHRWPGNEQGTFDEESYALIVCDKQLYKKIFDRFWFALGYEVCFQGIIVEPSRLNDIARWSRKKESKRKYKELLEISCLLFENLENGFHFRVSSSNNFSDSLKFSFASSGAGGRGIWQDVR